MKASVQHVGCLVDGHWGQYGIARMIEIATDFGYLNAEDVGLARRKLAAMMPSNAPALSDDDEQKLIDAADDVERWLNDNVAQDGHSFGWNDGEFFYMAEEWWAV